MNTTFCMRRSSENRLKDLDSPSPKQRWQNQWPTVRKQTSRKRPRSRFEQPFKRSPKRSSSHHPRAVKQPNRSATANQPTKPFFSLDATHLFESIRIRPQCAKVLLLARLSAFQPIAESRSRYGAAHPGCVGLGQAKRLIDGQPAVGQSHRADGSLASHPGETASFFAQFGDL
jgi:hypothetical protein